MALLRSLQSAQCSSASSASIEDPQNAKMYRAQLEDFSDVLALRRRLGFARTFPYIQPEFEQFQLPGCCSDIHIYIYIYIGRKVMIIVIVLIITIILTVISMILLIISKDKGT